MNYYFAPLEGITDRIYRREHQRIFGAENAPTRYYAPFITPSKDCVLIERKIKDILPEENEGVPVVPQLLSRDPEATVWLIKQLRGMGYDEINLNFGCPSGTVTAKGKGAGMLRNPQELERFLDGVFSHAEGKISVKTRMGIERVEEFEEILAVYNRFPICELTVHPRVMRQLYRGEADRQAFGAVLPQCKMPVCYNGDINRLDRMQTVETAFPNLSGMMLGRGLVADPALLRKRQGGAAVQKEELQEFVSALYRAYSIDFGAASSAVNRMKALWQYLFHLFEESEGMQKQLRRVRTPWEYEVTVGQIFVKLRLKEGLENEPL